MSEQNKPIRVLFIVTAPYIWPSTASIWQAAQDHENIASQVQIAEVPTGRLSTKDFSGARMLLTKKDIPFAYFSVESFLEFMPDIVFLPFPYDHVYPKELFDLIKITKAKIAYVPYGVETGGGGTNMTYQFNQFIQNNAWRVVARSANHRKLFAKYKENGSANVIVGGCARQDLLSDLSHVEDGHFRTQAQGRKIILWTPHFSVSRPGDTARWSSFFYVKDHILQIATQMPDDLLLILRPHPQLFDELKSMLGWSAQDIASFKQQIANIDNIYFDEDPDYLPAFKASDALIADVGSFFLEYLLLDKPMFYCKCKDGFGLNDEAEAIEKAISVLGDDPYLDIKTFIQSVCQGQDALQEARRQIADSVFFKPKTGGVGEHIVHRLYQEALQDLPTAAVSPTQEEFDTLVASQTKSPPLFYWPNLTDDDASDIKQTLNGFPKFGSALDLACADGRATSHILEYAKHWDVSDPRHACMAKARALLTQKNIKFKKDNIFQPSRLGRYDLVTLLGGFRGVISEKDLNTALSNIFSCLRPGGMFVLKDLISEKGTRLIPHKKGEVVSRDRDQYIYALKMNGFELKDMHKFTSQQGSYLFVLERTPV